MININNCNVSRGHTLNLQKMRKNEMHTMQSFWDCIKWKQMKIYAHATFCCIILFSHEFILGQKNKAFCRIKCLYLCLPLLITLCFWVTRLCFSSFVLWSFGGHLILFCPLSWSSSCAPLYAFLYVCFLLSLLWPSNLNPCLLISHISF